MHKITPQTRVYNNMYQVVQLCQKKNKTKQNLKVKSNEPNGWQHLSQSKNYKEFKWDVFYICSVFSRFSTMRMLYLLSFILLNILNILKSTEKMLTNNHVIYHPVHLAINILL